MSIAKITALTYLDCDDSVSVMGYKKITPRGEKQQSMLKKISFRRAEKLFKEGNFTKVIFLNQDGTKTKSKSGNPLDLLFHVESGGKLAIKKTK